MFVANTDILCYYSCKLRKHSLKRLSEHNIGEDYGVANTHVIPWPHEISPADVEKPTENIGLSPMCEENYYVHRESEWATQRN